MPRGLALSFGTPLLCAREAYSKEDCRARGPTVQCGVLGWWTLLWGSLRLNSLTAPQPSARALQLVQHGTTEAIDEAKAQGKNARLRLNGREYEVDPFEAQTWGLWREHCARYLHSCFEHPRFTRSQVAISAEALWSSAQKSEMFAPKLESFVLSQG